MRKLKFGDKLIATSEVNDEGSILGIEDKEKIEDFEKINVKVGDNLLYVAKGKVNGINRVVLYSKKYNQLFFPVIKVFKSYYKKK